MVSHWQWLGAPCWVMAAAPRADPTPGMLPELGGEGREGRRAEIGERSRYTSWAAHTINRSGCKRLPKHLLCVPDSISVESPAVPRSSSQLSPTLSETCWGCRRVQIPGKQLLGSSWLQPHQCWDQLLGFAALPWGWRGHGQRLAHTGPVPQPTWEPGLALSPVHQG